MAKAGPEILLLGGGYTLTRLAHKLDPSEFLITSTSAGKIERFLKSGWNAHKLNITVRGEVDDLFQKHPGIKIVVDSVPPVAASHVSGPAVGAGIISETSLKNSVKRIIYLSTTGVFGVHDGSLVTEETATNPDNPRAVGRYLSEQAYLNSGVEVVVFRIAAIYGPGRGIGCAIKRGTYRLIKGYDRWSNRIHVDDLVTSIHAAICTDSQGLSPVFCLSDGQPELTSKVVEYYCSKFNLPPPPQISLEEAKKGNLHSLISNQKISNSFLREKLKISLKYPSYKEGAATEFLHEEY